MNNRRGRVQLKELRCEIEINASAERLNADHVRFTQREIFTRLLVPLRAHRLDTDTRRGFNEMNQALKKRAEQSRSSD